MSSLVHKHPPTPSLSELSQEAAIPHRLIGGLSFDWLTSLLGLVLVGGVFLDGWAHNHDRVDQSFFTPWHAFLYGGYFVLALVLVGTLWTNHRRGAAWNNAMPTGYSLSIFGLLVFAAGGAGDMLWHEIFGVEADFDALFSPTHLLLAIGINLIITGPLRAAWARPGHQLTWQSAGPALLSLTTLISGFTFMTMGSHPLSASIAGATHEYNDRIGQIAGTVSILFTTVLLMGPTLLVMRRWQLPAGSLIVVWGINTFAMFIVNWHHDYTLWHALAMFAAIIVIEIVRQGMEPLAAKRGLLHIFAALAPFLLMTSYFIALHLTEGTRWTIHMWTGILVEVAIVGWLLSFLVYPPTIPGELAEGENGG